MRQKQEMVDQWILRVDDPGPGDDHDEPDPDTPST